MDQLTEQIASYAASLNYKDLRTEAIHAVKRSVVDSIGCAIGAFSAEPVKAARSVATRVTCTTPATLIGTRIQTSPELAGFVNGVMIRYLDFNDDYMNWDGPHPSDSIGTIWAVAESIHADGKSLVLGITLAYEICNQFVDSVNFRGRGWDYTLDHSMGTAMAAGRILGLNKEQLENALSLSIIPYVSLWQTRLGEISMWKGCAGANGARNGLFAVLLAKEGMTGPEMPFDGDGGLRKWVTGPFELDTFGGRDHPFKVERTFLKALPIKYTAQLPVWTALELRQKVNVEDIQSLCMYGDRLTKIGSAGPEEWNPKSRESADHSYPYLVAAALIDGEITSKTFTPERYRDPIILAMAKKISAEEDPLYSKDLPDTFHCRLEATLRSGEVVAVHQTNPRGHPSNPMTDQEINDKFLRLVEPSLTSQQSRALLDELWNLEKLHDVSQPFKLMVV